MVRASGSLVRFHFPVGEVVSDAERPGVLGGSKRFVVVECGAVGVLDGAQPGLAGGDGLAVGAADWLPAFLALAGASGSSTPTE
jgi:hypothetical protein